MKATADVRLKIPSEKRLETVFSSLKPEVTNVATTRSRAVLEKKEEFLILKIEAKDTVALRAALNAYLRWINSIFNVLGIIETR
jgi:tRNA threonylcarbamoyladenosine modification (KEOPS) complex  Pcc1 subunit